MVEQDHAIGYILFQSLPRQRAVAALAVMTAVTPRCLSHRTTGAIGAAQAMLEKPANSASQSVEHTRFAPTESIAAEPQKQASRS
jgi:hypothetical protein